MIFAELLLSFSRFIQLSMSCCIQRLDGLKGSRIKSSILSVVKLAGILPTFFKRPCALGKVNGGPKSQLATSLTWESRGVLASAADALSAFVKALVKASLKKVS